MEFAVLGWPDEGVTLRLDHHEFAYAGKFTMSATGKAAILAADASSEQPGAREAPAEGVLAAVAFDADRTAPEILRVRYITVRADRRGEGLGPRLAAFVAERAADCGHESVRIAVNNPFAYEAMYKAGFAYTGTETGLAELVLERPAGAIDPDERDRPTTRYRAGLDRYRGRDLSTAEERFLDAKRDTEPPPTGSWR